VSAVAAAAVGARLAQATCRSCRHFVSSPREVEAGLPGLSALGSTDGAVRGGDGLCGHHDRYLAAASHCLAHVARRERLPGPACDTPPPPLRRRLADADLDDGALAAQ
jgi:hypothetical protein